MRRKEREVRDSVFFQEIFSKCEILVLSFHDGEFPYAVPLSFVEYEGALYMHCALEGHKLDCMAKDPHVHFSICESSVLGTGFASLVDDAELKRRVLAALAAKYESECTLPVPDRMLAATGVIKVDIHSMTGKRNDVDSPVPFHP